MTLELKIKQTRLNNYCLKYKHGHKLMNTENSKRDGLHIFFNLSQRLDLTRTDRHVALQNSPIYYTWKKLENSIRKINLK